MLASARHASPHTPLPHTPLPLFLSSPPPLSFPSHPRRPAPPRPIPGAPGRRVRRARAGPGRRHRPSVRGVAGRGGAGHRGGGPRRGRRRAVPVAGGAGRRGGGWGAGRGGGAAAAANAANPWALSGSLARSAELGGLAAMAARVVLARWAARSADGLAAATAAATAGSGGGGTGPSPPVAEPASSASPALPSPAPPPPPAIRLGDDARAAAAAARAVGAALVLGDRPIELTVSRAWAALTWRDRVAAALLAAGARPTSPLVAGTALPALLTALAAVEGTAPDPPAGAGGVAASPATAPIPALDALRSDPAALAAMVAALDAASPRLGAALVHERDEWLAWSAARSAAVGGTAVVVAVVGAGHVRGVVWHLLDGAHRPLFKELAGQGVGRRAGRAAALRRLAVETVVVAGAVAAWQAVTGGGVGRP